MGCFVKAFGAVTANCIANYEPKRSLVDISIRTLANEDLLPCIFHAVDCHNSVKLHIFFSCWFCACFSFIKYQITINQIVCNRNNIIQKYFFFEYWMKWFEVWNSLKVILIAELCYQNSSISSVYFVQPQIRKL